MLRLKHLWAERSGASLVEFTIVMPFLVLLGFGTFEFGSALYGHHMVTTGLRDAARYLARVDDPTSSTEQDKAKQLAAYGQIGGSTKRVSWWDVGAISVTTSAIANPINASTGYRTYRGPDPIRVVRVATTATYPGLGLLAAIGLGPTLPINVYHEERSIGE